MKTLFKSIFLTFFIFALASCQQPSSSSENLDSPEKVTSKQAQDWYNEKFLNKTLLNPYCVNYPDGTTWEGKIIKITFQENTVTFYKAHEDDFQYKDFNNPNLTKQTLTIDYMELIDNKWGWERDTYTALTFHFKEENVYKQHSDPNEMLHNKLPFGFFIKPNYPEEANAIHYKGAHWIEDIYQYIFYTSSESGTGSTLSDVEGTYQFNNANNSLGQSNGSITLNNGNWTYDGYRNNAPSSGTYSISGNTITFNWTYGGYSNEDSFTVTENGSNVKFTCTNSANSLLLNALFGIVGSPAEITFTKTN